MRCEAIGTLEDDARWGERGFKALLIIVIMHILIYNELILFLRPLGIQWKQKRNTHWNIQNKHWIISRSLKSRISVNNRSFEIYKKNKFLDFFIFLSTVCTNANLINQSKVKQNKTKHNLFTNLNQNSQNMKNHNIKYWLHRLILFLPTCAHDAFECSQFRKYLKLFKIWQCLVPKLFTISWKKN